MMTQIAERTEGLTAEKRIRKLAEKHGIKVRRTSLDEWANDVSRLSDCDVRLDEVQELLVGLREAKIITGTTSIELHSAYLNQKSV